MNAELETTEIDSTCVRRLASREADGDTERDTDEQAPATIAPRCNAPAVTWVLAPNATRRYLCLDHAAEVFRFEETGPPPDGIDAPEDDREASRLPDLIPGPEADREARPVVVPCPECLRMTRRADMESLSRRCPECRPATASQS